VSLLAMASRQTICHFRKDINLLWRGRDQQAFIIDIRRDDEHHTATFTSARFFNRWSQVVIQRTVRCVIEFFRIEGIVRGKPALPPTVLIVPTLPRGNDQKRFEAA